MGREAGLWSADVETGGCETSPRKKLTNAHHSANPTSSQTPSSSRLGPASTIRYQTSATAAISPARCHREGSQASTIASISVPPGRARLRPKRRSSTSAKVDRHASPTASRPAPTSSAQGRARSSFQPIHSKRRRQRQRGARNRGEDTEGKLHLPVGGHRRALISHPPAANKCEEVVDRFRMPLLLRGPLWPGLFMSRERPR